MRNGDRLIGLLHEIGDRRVAQNEIAPLVVQRPKCSCRNRDRRREVQRTRRRYGKTERRVTDKGGEVGMRRNGLRYEIRRFAASVCEEEINGGLVIAWIRDGNNGT